MPAEWIDALTACRARAIALIDARATPGNVRTAVGAARKALRKPSELLPALRASHPKLRLYLREDQTERLLARLRSGDLDLALIALPYETGELRLRELGRDEFWFVSLADDPLAKQKAVAVEALDPRDVVLLEEGHCLRDHAMQACGAHPPWSESVIEATSLTTLLQMVENGLGVTLLPEMALKSGILDNTRLIARPFSTKVPARVLALAARPTSSRLTEMEILAGLIEAARRPPERRTRAPRSRSS